MGTYTQEVDKTYSLSFFLSSVSFSPAEVKWYVRHTYDLRRRDLNDAHATPRRVG